MERDIAAENNRLKEKINLLESDINILKANVAYSEQEASKLAKRFKELKVKNKFLKKKNIKYKSYIRLLELQFLQTDNKFVESKEKENGQ